MNFLANKRRLMLLLIDFLVYTCVYGLVVLLQTYTSEGLTLKLDGYLVNYALFLVFIFGARFALRNYSNVWRYANSLVFLKMVISDAVGGIAALLVTLMIPGAYINVWISAAMVTMCNVATLMSRFVYQQSYRYTKEDHGHKNDNKIGVAIVGAGQIGAMLADELIYNPASHYRPVCFIDKDKDKVGNTVCGIRVYADDDSIIFKLRELPVQEVFIALPELSNERARALHEFYARSGCKVKVYDFPLNDEGNEVKTSKRVIRELRIEDLLFRDTTVPSRISIAERL